MGKKTITLIVLLCLTSGSTYARQVISGTVSDKVANKAIDAASVELLQLPDSSMIESTYTNSEGSFMLVKADTAKSYCLRVRQFNYKKRIIPVPHKSGSRIINVGNVALEPSSITLREITVNGSKIQVTELPDRTVYGISSDLRKTSTDGLDVIRKVPSVQVDYFSEEIKVDGKSNIQIEVDGVTRDKSYLKKLHPSQIAKLEVITNPTGKYDADIDAVINIITDREARYGLKGMVNTQLMPNATDRYLAQGNGSLDYGRRKISYYISANGGTGKFGFFNTMDRNSGVNVLHRNGKQNMLFSNGYINTGFIYDPDEKNNLNVNISYNGNSSKSKNDQTTYNSENEILKSINGTVSNSTNKNGGINSSVFYKHRFDKKKNHAYEIETNFYSSLRSNNRTDFQNINYDLDSTEVLPRSPLQTEESKTRRTTLNTRASYTLPFDSVYTFGTGINGNYSQNNIDNISTISSNVSNLDYKNIKGTFFAELSRIFKKGNVKMGARVEVSYVTINTTNTNKYFSPLPYLNGQYKINDRNSLKLNYSRRVIRPSNSQLNPFVSVVDSQTISMGNIDLKPAYRDNFQLTCNIKYGKNKFSGSLSPQIFFEYRTNLIQYITQFSTDENSFVRKPENISNGYETGAALSANAQISAAMFNTNFRYIRSHIDKYLDQIDAVDRNSWSWNSQLMCPLSKTLRLFTMLNLTGPMINGQEVNRNTAFYILGLSKQFKNNSTFTVITLNPLSKKTFYNTTTINNSSFYQRSESYMNLKNAIMFNYSYNFKVGKEIKADKRSVEQEMEENNAKLPF